MRSVQLFLSALVLAGVFAVATPARAQWNASSVCLTDGNVPGLFDPNAFVGAPKCTSLCEKSASYCAKFVKNQVSCYNTSFKGFYALAEKIQCDTLEDPNERKDCKVEIKDGSTGIKEEVVAFGQAQLDDCKLFEAQCKEACTSPMP